MKIGPKYKIAKRLGAPVFEKTQTRKFALSEARASKRGKFRGARRPSDYGRRFVEKQKVRFTYGISERQLSRYATEAARKKSGASRRLFSALESRLDNTVYRLGFAKTRRLARQLVSHGHIAVNGRKVRTPSYCVSPGETVAVRENSKRKKVFAEIGEGVEGDERKIPQWLSVDLKSLQGKIESRPEVADPAELLFDLQSVVEFY